ncbi:hypothetical protein JCGZ_20021 [Jatropha curcas]|uniref:Uncharacterized protein n=1 Tax=Jatropha curcas TaxID=180498 RepID=A0A067JU39_JATCU|nr:hypothetical protein JCGZ_20021 [Jatropha curcas]
MEVFIYIHIKKHNGVTFMDKRMELVRIGEQPIINALQLYLEAARGKKKKKVYCAGSQSSVF